MFKSWLCQSYDKLLVKMYMLVGTFLKHLTFEIINRTQELYEFYYILLVVAFESAFTFFIYLSIYLSIHSSKYNVLRT